MTTVAQLDGKFYDAGGAVYNVQHSDYGAVGDGSTDDAAAIQAAIDAAAAVNGVVLIPHTANSYQIGTALTLTSGCRGILGMGSPTLQANAAGVRVFTATSVDDFFLAGLRLLGNSGSAETSANQLVNLTNCNRVDVRGNKFENGFHRCLYLVGCEDSTVQGNQFLNCSNGPYFTGCVRTSILNNVVQGSQQDDGTFKVGIALQTHDATYGLNQQIVVSGNRVEDLADAQAFLAHGGQDIIFSDNISTGCTNGLTASAAGANDTMSNLVIEGNVFVGTGAVAYSVTFDVGISLNGTQAALDGVLVVGNVLDAFNLDAEGTESGGISVLGGNNVTIKGNHVRDGWGCGVVFSGANSTGVLVQSNTIIDLTGSAATGGIKVDSPTDVEGAFLDNRIEGCDRAFRLETSDLSSLKVESFDESLNTGASTGTSSCVFNGVVQPASADTTPSVALGARAINFNNAGATTVTQLDDGVNGQIIVMRDPNGNTTISENSDGGGNFRLDTNSNLTLGTKDTLAVIFDGTDWLEISRSTN